MKHHPTTGSTGSPRSMRGQSATEFLIVLPALIFLLFGVVQWSLIYQARATLNHAALLAARAGALNHGSRSDMKSALAAGLTPLFASEASTAGYVAARAQAVKEIAIADLASFEIVNPTTQAFDDFGQDRLDGVGAGSDREIPNDTLNYRNPSPGSASGVSVQDANLLHLRVSYCYRLIVPVVGRMIHTVSNALTPLAHSLQAHGMSDPFGIGDPPPVDSCTRPLVAGPRIRILSEAVVRMQSSVLPEQPVMNLSSRLALAAALVVQVGAGVQAQPLLIEARRYVNDQGVEVLMSRNAPAAAPDAADAAPLPAARPPKQAPAGMVPVAIMGTPRAPAAGPHDDHRVSATEQATRDEEVERVLTMELLKEVSKLESKCKALRTSAVGASSGALPRDELALDVQRHEENIRTLQLELKRARPNSRSARGRGELAPAGCKA